MLTSKQRELLLFMTQPEPAKVVMSSKPSLVSVAAWAERPIAAPIRPNVSEVIFMSASKKVMDQSRTLWAGTP